jgi:hypothetical protein
MFEHTIDLTDPGTSEALRRLEAYVDLRLSPSVTTTTRMRMNVMNAAHRRAALIAGDATVGSAGPVAITRPAEHRRTSRSAWRRSGAVLLAASLTLGIVGAASAAKPGGPLYAARLMAETIALPTDPLARAGAEVARLEERLREVEQATMDGDGPAVQAALAAYSAIVAEAEQASDGDAAASAAIGASVARHLGVLAGLVGSVPVSARAALEHALASSTKALDDFGSTGGAGSGGETGRPANGNGSVGGPPTKSGHPDGPATTPQPAKPTPSPTPSPRPEKPAPTSQPARPDKSAAPVKPGSTADPSGHNGPPSDK